MRIEPCIPSTPELLRPFVRYWLKAMGVLDQDLHRKGWELAWIAEHIERHFSVSLPGKRGLGIAVGVEPLCSLFPSCGADVVITDIDPSAENIKEWWVDTGQHCGGDVEKIHGLEGGSYKENVSFSYYDMRDPLPKEWVNGFDFLWSNNSVVHIGSIGAAMDFIVRSSEALKPGGIMVHTTEYAISGPPDDSVDGANSFMRFEHIMETLRMLRKSGMIVPTHHCKDWQLIDEETVDASEKFHHVKINSGKCVVTCVGFVAIKPL